MASHFLEVDEFENEEDRAEFDSVLTEFQGADDAMKIMLLEKKAGQEASFNLQKVDIQGVDRLYEYTENSVRDSIIRNYLIPPVLLLQTAGKMGTSKEIQDATNYYNGVVNYNQLILAEIFTELFQNTIIKNSGDFTIIQLKAKQDNADIIALMSNSSLDVEQKLEALKLLYGFSTEEALKLSGI